MLFGLLLFESIWTVSTMFDSAEVLLYIGLYDQDLDWGGVLAGICGPFLW